MSASTWMTSRKPEARRRAARDSILLVCLGSACAVVIPVLLSVAIGCGRSLLSLPPEWWGANQLSAAVTALACTAGVVGALWHLLSAAVALIVVHRAARADVMAELPDHDAGAAFRLLHRWGAPLVRRIAGGVLVVGITASPALAATDSMPDTDDLGWQPTANAPAQPGESESAEAPTTTHRVAVGESLWSITAGLLGPDATTADIATAWPRLYQANLEVIGTDPGLIHPGTLLTVPALTDRS